MASNRLPPLLREPLVHFLALGIGLFLLYAAVSDDPLVGTDRRIVVSRADVDWLHQTFSRQWNRPPTRAELDHLIAGRVREEVLYREAMAMGLDDDDTVVRRRMVQKLEFLSEDIAVAAAPTEQQLRAFYDANTERYERPARLSFSHIFFNADRRTDARTDAERVLEDLVEDPGTPSRAPERGDRFLLPHDFESRSAREVALQFGDAFADALFGLTPQDSWQGPLGSSYGYHLVWISSHEPATQPDLAAVADRVRTDFDAERRRQSNESFYESLRAQYDVVIEAATEAGQ